jgi:hypothetical protein
MQVLNGSKLHKFFSVFAIKRLMQAEVDNLPLRKIRKKNSCSGIAALEQYKPAAAAQVFIRRSTG